MSLPRITILTPTRGRPKPLRRYLESLARDPEGMQLVDEVVVVLSGSADISAAIDVPGVPVRWVAEPRPGVAIARNRLLDEAGTEFTVWFDDDTEVEPGTIRAHAEASVRVPEAAFFAGRSTARFEIDPPHWVQMVLKQSPWVYAQLDFGPDPMPLPPRRDRVPYGCNMSLRKSATKGIRYIEGLGRGADLGPGWKGHQVGGEETEFLMRMIESGARGYWVPQAHVLHWIEAKRLTIEHLRRHFFGQGAEHVLCGIPLSEKSSSPFQIRQNLRYWGARLTGKEERWFRIMTQMDTTRGMRAARKLLRDRASD